MVIDSRPTQLKHISRFHEPRQPTKTVKACLLVYLDKATVPWASLCVKGFETVVHVPMGVFDYSIPENEPRNSNRDHFCNRYLCLKCPWYYEITRLCTK
ncbi:hypothetical protein WN944_021071 [Citrus x changshan-huyou]|uniref:Uncharacterized protein n=1 Tax=Citrus x changshan-huyou TaxID=2935761 RepID=A0AAP0MW72_9ROSI